MPRLLLAALLVFACLAAPAAADELDRPLAAELTRRGRLMVSGRALGVWSNDSPNYFAGNSTWTVRADPALTYFLRDHLGVGGALSFGWSKAQLFPRGEYRTRDFALGAELIWSGALSARWRVLVRPFLGYGRAWGRSKDQELLPTGGGVLFADIENSLNYVRIASSLPFIYAFNANIGLGFGPDLLLDYLFLRRSKVEDSRGLFAATGRSAPGNSFRAQLGFSLGLYASF